MTSIRFLGYRKQGHLTLYEHYIVRYTICLKFDPLKIIWIRYQIICDFHKDLLKKEEDHLEEPRCGSKTNGRMTRVGSRQHSQPTIIIIDRKEVF